MSSLRISNSLILLFVFTSLAIGSVGQSTPTPWRLSNRLQFGLENDSNVEESIEAEDAARALRLQFNSHARRRWSRTLVQLSYHGGYQLYWAYAAENKVINELSARSMFSISDALRLGIESWGRLKMFLNKDLRYAIGDFGPSLDIRLHENLWLRASYKVEALDYASSDSYDYGSRHVHVRMDKGIATGLQISPEWGWRSYSLNRAAFEFSPHHQWVFLNARQNDQLFQYGGTIDWVYRGLLLNVSYFYEVNSSNSYGFSFKRQRLHVIAARELTGVLVRFYGSLQKKNYSDDILPILPLELDTEKEESNFLVVDLSREVVPKVILLFRFAYYKNESPWPNLYYTKHLANVGVELRF